MASNDRVAHLVELKKLNLNEDEVQINNPFVNMRREDLENFHLHVLRLMRRPEYFYFTCKYLLNIELLPFQCVILHEMWHRPFPMLIGSRGMGKSFILGLYAILRALFMQGRKVVITGSGFRQAKTVFQYAENIWHNSPILQSLVAGDTRSGPSHQADMWILRLGQSEIKALPLGDGCLNKDTLITYHDRFSTIANHTKKVWGNGKWRKTDEHYDNGVKPAKKIATRKGYSFEGTLNHRMRVARNGGIEWVRSDEMVIGDRILIDRSQRWHQGNEPVTEEEAYSVGLMVGDGCWTMDRRLSFATKDVELVDYLNVGTGISFQRSDECHYYVESKTKRIEWLNRWEMNTCYAKDKSFPNPILRSSRAATAAFISALYDTDGHIQVSTAKGGTSITVGFTNTSEKLVDQLQFILLHFGIVAYKTQRDRDPKWNRVFELLITGPDVRKFHEQIGFRLKRKSAILSSALDGKARDYGHGDTVPGVQSRMLEIARKYRIKRGCATQETGMVNGKRIQQLKGVTHRLANVFCDVYAPLVKDPDEIQFIENLRSLANPDIFYDEITSIEDGKCHTYDIHVPNGHEYCANGFFSHNTKIRGQRANDIIADEFASIPREIFETVVRGFGVVNLSPVEQVEAAARKQVMVDLGVWTPEMEHEERLSKIGNQTIISGTAYYQFNHFCDYWKLHKGIIESKGDRKKLNELFISMGKECPPDLDWRDHSVIRFPIEMLPTGYMDQKQVDQSQAQLHSGIFMNEFGAVFSNDSNGFFKRSLIESCVTNTPILVSGETVRFNAALRGNPNGRYVYGVDPASEHDRFSIVVLEVYPTHRRLVYCWTTTRQEHQSRIKTGLNVENDFYGFCARKIRDLMKVFPCEHIALDSQGGGRAVSEALHDPDKIQKDELPIYEIRSTHPLADGKEKATDDLPGLHILEMVNFARAEWVADANHGMRKDFEDKTLLFPAFDPAILAVALEDDVKRNRIFDTLEDATMEIEECKEELATIIHSQTPGSNRDKWDTPEVKMPGSKKGRLRKDRYSGLLMANAAARKLARQPDQPEMMPYGGFVGKLKHETSGPLCYGPDWFTNPINTNPHAFGGIVRRGGVLDGSNGINSHR